MSDIFISYARTDRDRAQALASVLEQQGYSVCWDPHIPPGKTFDGVISMALNDAKCVVVLWSNESVNSDWVKEQASVSKQRQILIPAKIDSVASPLGFGLIHTADLTDWKPDTPHSEFDSLLKAISGIVGPPKPEPATSKPTQGKPSPQEPELTSSKSSQPETSPPKALTNTIGMKFVLIPAGTFTMGSPADEQGRAPDEKQHEVTITKPFYMQTTEVTKGQWAIMGSNPSNFDQCGDDCPVENVSWDMVQEFIRKLNAKEGSDTYRLPSEAEWEYACRAGTRTRYYTGDAEADLDRAGWYTANSNERTHPVGEKEPNGYGLYDMHGNVWELVADDWHNTYKGAPNDGSPWIDTPRGSLRVTRGGSWGLGASLCRSADRFDSRPDLRLFLLGFRLSRSVALDP